MTTDIIPGNNDNTDQESSEEEATGELQCLTISVCKGDASRGDQDLLVVELHAFLVLCEGLISVCTCMLALHPDGSLSQ